MGETQYYLIEHKIEKNRMPVLVRAFEVGNMKRKWTIIGPSDESGNLIEGATAKSIPQNAENGAGAGAVGNSNTLNQGNDESREKAAKTWSKQKPPEPELTPADESKLTYDGAILLAEPDIAPLPEAKTVTFPTDLPESFKAESQSAAAVDAAVSEPAATPLPRQTRKEVKLTDQLPPHDAEKEAQARAHTKASEAAAPVPATPAAPAAEEPAPTTRRRAPRQTTPKTNS